MVSHDQVGRCRNSHGTETPRRPRVGCTVELPRFKGEVLIDVGLIECGSVHRDPALGIAALHGVAGNTQDAFDRVEPTGRSYSGDVTEDPRGGPDGIRRRGARLFFPRVTVAEDDDVTSLGP